MTTKVKKTCALCGSDADVRRVPVIFEAEDGSYPKDEAVKMLLCAGCRDECELR